MNKEQKNILGAKLLWLHYFVGIDGKKINISPVVRYKRLRCIALHNYTIHKNKK